MNRSKLHIALYVIVITALTITSILIFKFGRQLLLMINPIPSPTYQLSNVKPAPSLCPTPSDIGLSLCLPIGWHMTEQLPESEKNLNTRIFQNGSTPPSQIIISNRLVWADEPRTTSQLKTFFQSRHSQDNLIRQEIITIPTQDKLIPPPLFDVNPSRTYLLNVYPGSYYSATFTTNSNLFTIDITISPNDNLDQSYIKKIIDTVRIYPAQLHSDPSSTTISINLITPAPTPPQEPFDPSPTTSPSSSDQPTHLCPPTGCQLQLSGELALSDTDINLYILASNGQIIKLSKTGKLHQMDQNKYLWQPNPDYDQLKKLQIFAQIKTSNFNMITTPTINLIPLETMLPTPTSNLPQHL